ncbi:MAG: hypothetical protein Q8R15_00760 [Candidatus Micrarchaeota archaeon]|nr:hypothetical protein [Candidatus Micrarchaeota archaeon]
MRKAFIAAPLIGTIIFVTAIVFVVNINKAETNAITQIAQESYHNRINSIVELYRSDAGSLFREDVKKVVEQALTSQCWNIFRAQIPDNLPADTIEEKMDKLQKARFDSCNRIKSSIQSVICSNTGETSGVAAVNACSGLVGNAYVSCLEENGGGSGSRTYGLQNFFNNINEDFSFEGIRLSPSNKEKFESFFNPPGQTPGSVDLVRYISNCNNLIKELTMDCSAFAGTASEPQPKLQCCSKDAAFGQTCQEAGGEIIPGCESGIFYVKITPSEQGVFESLPRIQASDDAGNYLRAGAIADVDEFYLPITFPLMKYLNASFNAYQILAFGPHIGENDNEAEGILDGVCYAGSLCSATEAGASVLGPGFIRSSGDQLWPTREEARNSLADTYYENVFKPAFETLPQNLEISLLSSNVEVARCKKSGADGNGQFQCTDTNGGSGDDAARGFIVPQTYPIGDRFSAYIGELTLNFRIVDTDPSFKVKPDANNELCTSAMLDFNPRA